MTANRVASSSVPPAEVRTRLSKHMLTDGFRLVLDPVQSSGSWVVDASTGQRYLDLYTFFSSSPLGCNPPELVDDADFMRHLAEIAANKPANSDIYTSELAEFVETFARVLGDSALPHLFFVEGGGLAVENALKCAFDWKSRQNEAAGRSRDLGTKVLHLTRAFHGRTGYTMSLTNTDPGKTERFPKFNWPRIDVPAITFPLADNLDAVEAAEARALQQAREAFEAHRHDIACFIAEPVQGEGGDNHMRPEFLQAMQSLCHEYEALFVVDEVQTGVGLTGTPWAYQQLGLEPDVVAFSKRVQVGGIMAGRRVGDVANNVFSVSGRINSTWGGGLADMVRSRRLLEIIERHDYIPASRETGEWLVAELAKLAESHSALSNVRGRGLMVAFDLPSTEVRGEVMSKLASEHQVMTLPSGERAIRFRPVLTITRDDLRVALDALDAVLTDL